MNNKKYLISTVLFSTILMSFIDGVIVPPYLYKSIFKIVLFLLIPFIFFLKNKDERDNLKQLFIPKKKDFAIAISLAIVVFGVILLGFFLLRNYIDFSGIVDSLTSGIGVNANNFIYVSVYISFINSLLEEFFFRGYAFLLIKKNTNRKFAYIFSAAMFAFYHAGMMNGWFNIAIYLIAMIGLFVAGSIFNFLNEKCNNIYPSWLVHMFANFAINTIGAFMFGFF